MRKQLRKLLEATQSRPALLGLTVLRSPFDALRTLLHAFFFLYAFRAIELQDLQKLCQSCLLWSLGNILLFLYNGCIWRIYASVTIKWTGKIRAMVFTAISSLPLKTLESQSSSFWITRLNSDVALAASVFSSALHLPHACNAVLNLIVSAVFLTLADLRFCLIILIFSLPCLWISHFFSARFISRYAKQIQDQKAGTSAALQIIITAADTALLYDAKEFLMSKFEARSKQIQKLQWKIRQKKILHEVLNSIIAVSCLLLILFLADGLIAGGTMAFSTLSSILQYRSSIAAAAAMILTCQMNMQAALPGLQRVNQTLTLPKEEC